jgi:hypothetical protein
MQYVFSGPTRRKEDPSVFSVLLGCLMTRKALSTIHLVVAVMLCFQFK